MRQSIFQVTPEMVEKANQKLMEAKSQGKSSASTVRFFGKESPVQVKLCPTSDRYSR